LARNFTKGNALVAGSVERRSSAEDGLPGSGAE
jgi:hypothetical protein